MPDAIGRLHWIVIDTADPARIAPFWCALLGVRERGWFGEDYLMLTADGGAPPVAFQRVPEAKAVKNRLHVDLAVDDLDDAFARIVALGGSAVSDILEMPGGYRWRVMADPEGNEFCIVPRDED
ncbi:MAG TPA: VOC family protein [Actinomycetota bacterium]|nr:VOC family protein [Actinomycetota bacterium]